MIADALGEEDPQNSAFYDANAKVFIRRITVVLGEITQQLGVFKDLSLIVFHDAFHNLVQRFAIAVVGAIYDLEVVSPSPKCIALVRDLVAAHKVQCVLASPLQNKGLVRAVAVDLQIVEADEAGAGFDLDSELYYNLLGSVGIALAACLTK